MALKALKCPSCGANLELDDGREFGFCEFCGAKVQIREIIEVRHSGQVKLDNTEQGRNLKTLGDRYYKTENYTEALNFYTQAIVYNPNDTECLYRRAICKIYCSNKTGINTKDFHNDFNLAYLYVSTEKYSDLIFNNMQAELNNLFFYMFNSLPSYTTIMSNEQSARDSMNIWIEMVDLTRAIISELRNDDYKEKILKEIITFCDEKPYHKLRFYRIINSQSGTTRTATPIKASDQTIEYFESMRKWFSNQYNSLPKKSEKYNELLQKRNQLTNEIDDAKDTIQRLKKYKDNIVDNPERDNIPGLIVPAILLAVFNLPWVICLIVFIIAFLVAAFSGTDTSSIAGYSCCFFTVCLIVSAIGSTATIIIYNSLKKRFYMTHDYITEKCDYDKYYNAKIKINRGKAELDELEKEISRYINQEMK